MKVGVKSNFGRWMLTSSLKMTEQINMTCQSVYYHLHTIRQIRKFLTPASPKLLVQGVIMAGIHYFNGLLHGVPAVRLSKLQRLQYSAARLITHTPRYCHITPLLLSLQWLPVKFRICHKIAVISFKTIHNVGPAFLSNLINFVELLMELKHCVRGFFPGSGKHLTCICNRWFVTPCDWSLVPIGLCPGWNWDERTLLMELKRLHEVSHSKYLKGLGMSKCGLGAMTLWSKWTVGPTARKVTIRCRAWDLESSVSTELGAFFFAKY